MEIFPNKSLEKEADLSRLTPIPKTNPNFGTSRSSSDEDISNDIDLNIDIEVEDVNEYEKGSMKSSWAKSLVSTKGFNMKQQMIMKKKTQEFDKQNKIEEQRIVLNVSDTKYEVVKYVGQKLFQWKLLYYPEGEWDILWTDNAIQVETLAKMKPYQKVNHFPGMYSLARKNYLGLNLTRMKKHFPKEYKFFPRTWLLPAEYNDFKVQFTKKKNKTYIIKPEASCQGRGIFLTRTHECITPGDHYVAQKYLDKPFLIEGLKFDFRIYVLLAGCDPLKIFLYKEGLVRFATEIYEAPSTENLQKICMHLTNYAINKDNPNFIFNKNAQVNDIGHKRSLKSVLNLLESQGHNVKYLWKQIKQMVVKTFCSVQPILAHNYKSCQPDEPYNNMCFELLGFDIMLDDKLKPWLIEVNHTPSFTIDTPLDKSVKLKLIRDTLKLLNISYENKLRYKQKRKQDMQKRILTGKKVKLTPEEKHIIFETAQKSRDAHELRNLGDFEKIYPLSTEESGENYEGFIKIAYKWWEEWTGTSVKKSFRKIDKLNETALGGGVGANRVGDRQYYSINSIPPVLTLQNRAKEIQNIYTRKIKNITKNRGHGNNGNGGGGNGSNNTAAASGDNGNSNTSSSILSQCKLFTKTGSVKSVRMIQAKGGNHHQNSGLSPTKTFYHRPLRYTPTPQIVGKEVEAGILNHDMSLNSEKLIINQDFDNDKKPIMNTNQDIVINNQLEANAHAERRCLSRNNQKAHSITSNERGDSSVSKLFMKKGEDLPKSRISLPPDHYPQINDMVNVTTKSKRSIFAQKTMPIINHMKKKGDFNNEDKYLFSKKLIDSGGNTNGERRSKASINTLIDRKITENNLIGIVQRAKENEMQSSDQSTLIDLQRSHYSERILNTGYGSRYSNNWRLEVQNPNKSPTLVRPNTRDPSSNSKATEINQVFSTKQQEEESDRINQKNSFKHNLKDITTTTLTTAGGYLPDDIRPFTENSNYLSNIHVTGILVPASKMMMMDNIIEIQKLQESQMTLTTLYSKFYE